MMRTGVIASDPAAQAAAATVMAEGGTAVDAVLAGLLAGATRASAASLLGSAGILVAGPGVGRHYVDGRARAPGLGEKRGRSPATPPPSWSAVVPGLPAAVLVASTRFGSASLATLARAVTHTLTDFDPDAGVRARMGFLQQLSRSGLSAMEREGVLQGILLSAGPAAGGVFTAGDLAPVGVPVREAVACTDGVDEVLLPPRDRPPRPGTAPPAPPFAPVECVVAMDVHGVTAAAAWLVAPACADLPGEHGLALAGLLTPAGKGVPRWRPGAMVSCSMPLAVLVREGRAWAGLGVQGKGDVDTVRDTVLNARMAAAGMSTRVGDGTNTVDTESVALWALRDLEGDGVRTFAVKGLSEGS